MAKDNGGLEVKWQMMKIVRKLLDWLFYLIVLAFFLMKRGKGFTEAMNE